MINIRFNYRHSGASLTQWVSGVCDTVTQELGGSYELESAISGEAFLTEPGELSALVAGAVTKITGLTPELSTSGGTSDARFICKYAPVIEFGLANLTMHKIDENVPLNDINRLADIYELILRRYFALPESERA
jgi:succinyl-diaminopimelate desuccinylase